MPRKKPPPIIASGISCADAAELLGCSRAHVSHLIKNGELRAQRIVGRIMLVDPSSVVEYNKNPKRRDRGPSKKDLDEIKHIADLVRKGLKKRPIKSTVSDKVAYSAEIMKNVDQAIKEVRGKAKKIIHPVTIKASKNPSKKKFSEAVKKAQKKLAKKTPVKKKTTAKKKKTARRRVKV